MKTIACALILSVAAAAPSLARDGNWQVGNDQIHVIDSTLNTATIEGRARLLDRVQQAAKTLCRDHRVQIDREQCVVEAVRQAARTQNASGRALALALDERRSVQQAAR